VQTAKKHLVRWVCLCGNLIKKEPQFESLKPQTLRAVGSCCPHLITRPGIDSVMQIVELPIRDERHPKETVMENSRREPDPGDSLGKEEPDIESPFSDDDLEGLTDEILLTEVVKEGTPGVALP